jgi:hypothetical protein
MAEQAMTIRLALIDELLKEARASLGHAGEDGLLKQLTNE